MLTNVSFVVPGEPVAKERPRAGRNGFYTPRATLDYERAISAAAHNAMKGAEAFSGPVVVWVRWVATPPASWSKKRRQEAINGLLRPHASRKDVDNVAKTLLDGCNGIVWGDDRQVVTLMASKYYGDADYVHFQAAQWVPGLDIGPKE